MTCVPLVSIIVPCYRQAHLLPEALQSIYSQTYPRIETIVVNDGSDDHTDTVAADHQDRITYLKKDNGGLPSARNAAICVASGDYLLFLDADDVLHPVAVEALVQGAASRFDTLAIMDFGWFDGQPPKDDALPIAAAEPLKLLPRLINGNIGVVHAHLCPRQLLDEHGGFDEGLTNCHDYDLWLRLAFGGAKGVHVPFVGAYYRRVVDSMSKNLVGMLRSRTELLLRCHRRVMGNAALLASCGPTLLGAEYRVRRRWIATGADPDMIAELSARIAELQRAGVRLPESWKDRLLRSLPGVWGERALLGYYRRFKPRVFSDYADYYA